MSSERTLPHNLEAERSVLGAILVHNDAFNLAAQVIDAGDFFRDAHQRIFEKMAALAERHHPIDFVTLREELARDGVIDEVGGPAYIASLVDGVPRATNVEYYARIVADKARRRNLIHRATRILSIAYDESRDTNKLISEAASSVSELSASLANQIDAFAFVESWPVFRERVSDDVPSMLIRGLVPGDGLTLSHGLERTLKTWCELEKGIALTTGTPAFGICQVLEPAPWLYITNEDNEQHVKHRIWQLLRGRGLSDDKHPEMLHLAVRRGVQLDDPSWQDRVIQAAKHFGCRLVSIEPLRSVTTGVDQGPRDVQPFMMFCRRLSEEAGCVVSLAHHDVKPPQNGRDERQRTQRVSGGGIVSHVEAPIHFERISEHPPAALLTPASWKHSESPPPIEVRLTIDDSTARVLGQYTTAEEAESLAVHSRIIDYLRGKPDSTGNKVAQGARLQKQAVLRALEQLHELGRVDSRPGPRNANLWFLVATGSSGSDWFQNQ